MNFDLDTPEGMRNAIAWMHMWLGMIRDGGVWIVPRAASAYKVDRTNKTLTRVGMKPDTAINRVAAAMGWTVIEKQPNGTA